MRHSKTGTARKLFMLMCVLCCTLTAVAQTITVSGTVTDDSGETLIGANVMVQGQTTGVNTDIDGNYSIKAPANGSLVFSYVGYDNKVVPIDGRNVINVTMETNSIMLNEVVTIGYGTVKKSDATGSVSVVKPDEVIAGISTSAQDMLVGQAPGVVVTTSGGPKGNATIRIRGGSSLNASNNPLIVIDGVPTEGGEQYGLDPLSMISPDNIESMTVLKDASATAIYGSRASNGVIIITTKKGHSGKPQVTFTANMHINSARKKVEVLSTEAFRDMIINHHGAESVAASLLGDASTNWQDEVLRTSISSDYNLSVGGQAGFLPYRVSGSYTNSNGIIRESKMDRANLSISLNPKFFDDHLQVNANAQGYYIRTTSDNAGAVSGAISFDPTKPVYTYKPIVGGDSGQQYLWNGYYENDTQTSEGKVELLGNTSTNPIGSIYNNSNNTTTWRSTGNLQLDYSMHFLPELHANLNLGYDVSKYDNVSETLANSRDAWLNHSLNGSGYRTDNYQFRSNTLLEFYLDYKKEVEDIYSNFDVMAGYSWQRSHADGHYSGSNGNSGYRTTVGYTAPYLDASGNGYVLNIDPATESLIGKNYSDDLISEDGNYHWANHLQLLSFYGRFNYSFKNRYLLTATLRGDATSRFSKDNRWGVFPSVALGWKINDEPWMEATHSWLNDLKLRLGWGMTGQQEIGSTLNYMALYTISAPTSAYTDGSGKYILAAYPLGYNADLKWETTTTYNIALDFGLFNNRISGNIDVYKRVTKDLLSFVTVPAGSSTTNMLNRNVGELENYGVEFNLITHPVSTRNFDWTLSYNVAYNHNEITQLYDANSVIKVGGIAGGRGNTCQAHAVGHAASTFFLYQQVYDANGAPIEGAYVDQNGDGQIDDADLVLSKSPDPKVTMTLGSNFRYKNWDLGFSLRASLGNYVYYNVLSDKINLNYTFMQNSLNNVIATDYYFNAPQYLSDYFLRDASFLRCDNITLGYTWDNLLSDKLRLRLYGAVQNPFVITKYKGLDPEVFGGIDNNIYPRAVTGTIGIVATF